MIVQNPLFLARPESGEDQDRLANAGGAQLGAFRGAGDAEPVGAGLGQRARNRNDAVAVGVALDYCKDFPPRGARALGIHVVADGAEIVRQRSQTYLSPDGAAIKFYGSCHWN